MGSILDAALQYAQAGFSVIPVKRSDKTPYTSNGSHSASLSPMEIRQWWRWWPDANVAIVCGSPSGNLVAIDVDVKDGKHGDTELQAWQAQHGDFPSTVVQITGSGGMHYFFRCPDIAQFKNKVDALPGVDIRGEYAYVVVAPSVYEDGRAYAWEHDVSLLDTDEIAEANESVLALLKMNSKNEESASETENQRGKLNVADIREGQRNDSIFRYAALQRGANVPINVTLTGALELNAGWSDPLPVSEVKKAVKSAYKYKPNEATIYGQLPDPEPEPEETELTSVDDIPEEDVDWLIPGYIPKGQITLLCGTGGTGKTSVWVSMLSSLSSGSKSIFDGDAPPDQIHRDPLTVMFFSAEDTVENVIKKRLRKQGANMKNIVTLSISDQRFDKVRFGSKYLESLIKRYRPAVCVFDPLQAFVDGRIKMADRNAMRHNLRCLIEWGKKYGTTFLIVMHTNKLLNVWGRNRMADSADLWDIARCVLMVGDTQAEGVKYLSHEKNNYGKTSRTLLFKNENGMPTWERWTDEKDREFVTAAAKVRNERRGSSDIEEAEEFIMSTLMEYPEGLFTKELDSLLDDTGFKRWAIKKAKSNLKDKRKIKYSRTGMNDPWRIKKT